MLEAKNGYLVIEEVDVEIRTNSGLILSEKNDRYISKGQVLPQEGNPFSNETVVFKTSDSIKVSEGGKEYLLVESCKILSIIK